jgi:hypothetical protein
VGQELGFGGADAVAGVEAIDVLIVVAFGLLQIRGQSSLIDIQSRPDD